MGFSSYVQNFRLLMYYHTTTNIAVYAKYSQCHKKNCYLKYAALIYQNERDLGVAGKGECRLHIDSFSLKLNARRDYRS